MFLRVDKHGEAPGGVDTNRTLQLSTKKSLLVVHLLGS